MDASTEVWLVASGVRTNTSLWVYITICSPSSVGNIFDVELNKLGLFLLSIDIKCHHYSKVMCLNKKFTIGKTFLQPAHSTTPPVDFE